MPKQPNMNDLMKQAQKMQEQLMQAQAAAAEQVIEGQAGGGVVKVTVTGGLEFQSVHIDPDAVDPRVAARDARQDIRRGGRRRWDRGRNAQRRR